MKADRGIKNVADIFFQRATKEPQRIAIAEKGAEISFGELAEEVQKYAAFLKKKGLTKGDRVLIFMPVSIRLYAVLLAVMQIGAVAVFLDPWSDLQRLKASAKLAGCKALVAKTKLRWLSRFLPVFRSIPLKLSPSGKSQGALKETEKINPDDTALITFTTGSSGIPKGANRTHGFLQNQLWALQKEIEPIGDDVCLTNLPVFTLSHLADGITSVIAAYNPRKPRKMKAAEIMTQLKEHGVKTLVLSPDFLMRLAKGRKSINTIELERIFTGGGPLFPDQAKVISEAFPGIKSVVAYGSTEAEPISSIPLEELLIDEDLSQGGLPVGLAHPDCKVKIITWKDEVLEPTQEEFGKLELGQEEIGEIIVGGPHVLKEYFKNSEAQQRQKFHVGGELWHRTGDSGFLKNGRLYLTGPCQQLMEGQNGYISPFLVEYHLRQLNYVEEGALLQKEGSKILILVKKQSASKAQVKQELMAASIGFEQLRFVKRLPRDPRHNSKIDYQRLYYSS